MAQEDYYEVSIVEEVTSIGAEETTREWISDGITAASVNRIFQAGTTAALTEDIIDKEMKE
mgnify:FL=1